MGHDLIELSTPGEVLKEEFLDPMEISPYALAKSIFVDPPRSGMDEESCRFASRHEHILYISCNPETLVRDLELLSLTHDVVDMALFDQFPYTHHVEMGVKLIQRGLK